MTEEKKKNFKDWFDVEAVERLAEQVLSAWPDFDTDTFISQASKGLDTLEMMDRVKQMSKALADTLPENRAEALEILTRSLPPILPDCEAVTDGWLQWPVGQFIADYGIEHPEEAFEAMIELTQRFSSEFAVRPYAKRYPQETFRRLNALTRHSSPHVRRWCSEGIRPRLPWGENLKFLIKDPSPIWPILEALKEDPELYVRRSVANNLNDIAKDHPDAVVKRCKRWQGISEETDWIIRHGMRTLIKQGHPGALALLGYAKPSGLTAELTVSPDKVPIGKTVTLNATLTNTTSVPVALLIDYAVHYVRKHNRRSKKVFKWKTLNLNPGESITIRKTHAFKPMTIRTLYPGPHSCDLQVNGYRLATTELCLI